MPIKAPFLTLSGQVELFIGFLHVDKSQEIGKHAPELTVKQEIGKHAPELTVKLKRIRYTVFHLISQCTCCLFFFEH